MLTDEELHALDTWRFEKRMPSRASAVRELLRRGLTAEGFDVAAVGKSSRDFSIMDADEEEPPTPKESKN
jgi:hypothetical protein